MSLIHTPFALVLSLALAGCAAPSEEASEVDDQAGAMSSSSTVGRLLGRHVNASGDSLTIVRPGSDYLVFIIQRGDRTATFATSPTQTPADGARMPRELNASAPFSNMSVTFANGRLRVAWTAAASYYDSSPFEGDAEFR
jgi:hypothetical protein